MAIKVGFSSTARPNGDVESIIKRAAALGYDGFELRGPAAWPALAESLGDAGRVRAMLTEAGVRLACLDASSGTASASRGNSDLVRCLADAAQLAGRVGCPYIRLGLHDAAAARRPALSPAVTLLRQAAPLIARHGVTLLVENGGEFTTSRDLWFVIDAVGHPAVRGCWNPLVARLAGERPTVSVPRLANWIRVFHATDGRFDDAGRLLGHELPGRGDVGLDRAIELLKGVCYQGWLIWDRPTSAPPLDDPQVRLADVLAYLRQQLSAEQPVLSAYKGDKKAPNFKAPRAVEAAAGK